MGAITGMPGLILSLAPAAAVIAFASCLALVRLGHRLGHLDAGGVEGQIKADARPVPNTGGIAIVLGIALPVAAGLAALFLVGDASTLPASTLPASKLPGWVPEAARDAISPHLPGLRSRAPEAVALLAAVLAMHALGLVDDRRPLGPRLKLGAMTAVVVTLLLFSPETRLLTMLGSLPGGSLLSFVLTVLWLLAIANALNFMDNMDGLCGGVTAIAAACFLSTTLLGGQWFVSMLLALVLGATIGFLLLNRPPAKLFMGDGGSLVLGLLLGFLTVRTTYVSPSAIPSGSPDGGVPLHAALTPLVVLAVPLYDLVSVVIIRLSQGRSPMVGDLQHLSHRLVKRGLSRAGAVGLIVGLTGVTGLAGMLLHRAGTGGAWLVGTQVGVLLLLLATFERGSSRLVRESER